METKLLAAAQAARDNAYAPYSKFKVGAAVETVDGEIFTGCPPRGAGAGPLWPGQPAGPGDGLLGRGGERRPFKRSGIGPGPGTAPR